MALLEQQQLDASYIQQTYKRKPVEFVRGLGTRLFDDEGNEYLDFISGFGAVSMGHAHPQVTSALQEQAAKLLHVSNYYYVEGRGELARKISDLLSATADPAAASPWKLFFANSGAEANEGAIKLARKYGKLHLGGATTIVSARRSFHGRTLAALAATGQASKQESFGSMPPGFVHVELNRIEALLQELDTQGQGAVCAVLLECIQGEGGVYPCSESYLQAVRAQTAKRGILLLIDEVQTGFYRTGTYPFAFQHYGVMPDVVTIAKGMGNGVPIGALCAQGPAADILEPGDHGSTFGGSPLVVAAANATIDAMAAQDIATHVTEVGAYLQQQLAALPLVSEVRGKGLMLGAQLSKPVAAEVVDAALQNGLAINAVGSDILRFLPPLVCTTADIDVLIERLRALLDARS
ncbi:MAG: aspartate aminotransferase family protein [Coriobacteriales bacterium]|jgi:acetylornithine aminotransferase|nr:aspartate aminotransferase family protein [Coriobacteriales bacterium]